MLRHAFCSLLVVLALGAGSLAHAGMVQYADRGNIDFDTAMQLLDPYGTWAKVDGLWAYTPLDHQAPYTSGRWIYTEYGWYWKGDLPHSWATEHYGYWKRGADRLWSWFPGPYWLPEIVELRATSTHIGWRSAAVDDDGNFIEAPADRYAKTDEWSFVTKKQFAAPITPALIATPEATAKLLDDSSACQHTYVTYRPIDRPGPHPADFIATAADGGMFPPRGYTATTPALAPPPPVPAPAAKPTAPATNAATANSVPKPRLLTDPEDGGDAPADPRQVAYWITMSLPSYWTHPPDDAKPNEVYIYHPNIYQDQDGIERRIGLWVDPSTRTSQKQSLASVLGGGTSRPMTAPLAPGVPAVPVGSGSTPGAFRSPFDDSFHGSSSKASASTPAPVTQPAPSGRPGPAPSGAASNAAPTP